MVAAVIVAIGTGLPAASASTSTPAGRPNILFVLTDDMAKSELSVMPHVRALLADQGTSFSQAFVSVSLCCPSRTTILRGPVLAQHRDRDERRGERRLRDRPREGPRGLDDRDMAPRAGYRTGLFGKYLNGYPDGATDTFVPPGWDQFDTPTRGGNPYREYKYNLNESGRRIVHFGGRPRDYGTDVYSHLASAFMTRAHRDRKPFFAYLALYAPHSPATPPPGEAGLFPGTKAPRVPSYNEPDIRDKPRWLRHTPLMTAAIKGRVDALYRRRLQSLQAVDDAVANLMAVLQRNDQLDDTYVVFASDNGYHLGEHRMPAGKQTAYDEDIHVPFIVRGPGVPEDATRDQLVGNVDWAPTFAALAGAKAPDYVDGRSLVPLLRAGPAPKHWRGSYLIEHWREVETAGQIAARRDLPIEPPDPDQAIDETAPPRGPKYHGMRGSSVHDPSPEFHAIRTPQYLYVEYSTGENELYDLAPDPYELHNFASRAPAARLRKLHARVEALEHCRAASCRRAEAASGETRT